MECNQPITLHRWSSRQEPGDLTTVDLAMLFGLMLDEGLVETFFHDGSIPPDPSGLPFFMNWAMDPCQWFYGVRREGEWIGFACVNNFTSSGNTAMTHLLSFKTGRDGSFRQAGHIWFDMLHRSGIETAIAVIPACYRGVKSWAESFGFVECTRLPQALRVHRNGKQRITDAIMSVKQLSDQGA